jgi:hypothetical protein
MRPGTGGQVAIVDAILFMTIMLVASAVVIGSSGINSRQADNSSQMQQYAREFSETVLNLELTGLEYTGPSGEVVNLGNASSSVGRLLCDEAMILGSGHDNCDFTDYNVDIVKACGYIIRPGLDFAISCDGSSVFISRNMDSIAELPPTRSASQFEIFSDSGDFQAVTIIIYVWVG